MNSGCMVPHRCQRGFTLLEVLVAVMILGLTVTAILQQFAVALRAGAHARDSTRAMLYATEKLEELKTHKNLSLTTESGSFDNGYEWETEVLPYSANLEDEGGAYDALRHETLELRSRVTWRTGERRRQVELSTLLTVRKREWN
jgi:general secretion pathway protein I